jgi:hypothetical protein
MAQTPRAPNVEAQRTAMKKLEFLVGDWSGEATVLRGPGQFAEMAQTESAQFKLDGLVLMIEGVGRTKIDGKPGGLQFGAFKTTTVLRMHSLRRPDGSNEPRA